MVSGFSIGYMNFTMFLFLFSGIMILWIDVNGYAREGMHKEQLASRIMGWMSLVLAVLVYIGNWLYQKMY